MSLFDFKSLFLDYSTFSVFGAVDLFMLIGVETQLTANSDSFIFKDPAHFLLSYTFLMYSHRPTLYRVYKENYKQIRCSQL